MTSGSVVCAIVAYQSGLSGLLYPSILLLILPLGALLLVRLRRRRLEVVRTFLPSVVSAGSVAEVQLAVRNLSMSPSGPANWSDRLPWAPGSAGPGVLPGLSGSLPGFVPTGASTAVRYSLRPPTRGVFDIGPLGVEYSDPFTLATGSSSLGGVQKLSVVPAVAPLGEGGPSIIAGDGSARLIQRRSAGSDDDLMTREYRSGDALRRVHWRATARHGELMVRQEEQRTHPEARLLIDTRSGGYPDAWAELGGSDSAGGSFEWAVRMLASLGVHLHRAGFLVQVVETGPAQVTPLADANGGAGGELAFLVSLAAIAPSNAPLPRNGGIAGEERPEGLHGPVFAIISEPEPEALRWVAAQRRPFELGIAFVIGRRSSRAFTELTEAGWTCVPVRETDDPALAWASIARFTGGSAR
ncbi:MAG: hypothetical protein JWQ43_1232 [Glaciihabitans sp.]|nr:hypothetical protein [Glaciihabitans sp.]